MDMRDAAAVDTRTAAALAMPAPLSVTRRQHLTGVITWGSMQNRLALPFLGRGVGRIHGGLDWGFFNILAIHCFVWLVFALHDRVELGESVLELTLFLGAFGVDLAADLAP